MYLFVCLFRMLKCGSELHNNSVCTQLPVTYLVLKVETGVVKKKLKTCESRTYIHLKIITDLKK